MTVRTALCALLLSAPLLAPVAVAAQIPASEFKARRDSLAARIDSGVVVAFGGRTPVTDYGPFYQLPAFHYLTDYDEPDAAFVLVAARGRTTHWTFVTPMQSCLDAVADGRIKAYADLFK